MKVSRNEIKLTPLCFLLNSRSHILRQNSMIFSIFYRCLIVIFMLSIYMYDSPTNFYCVNLEAFFSIRVETVWILVRWLHQKPADLDLQCFKKRINLGSVGQAINWIRWLHRKPADLDLQCFQKKINLGSVGQAINYLKFLLS